MQGVTQHGWVGRGDWTVRLLGYSSQSSAGLGRERSGLGNISLSLTEARPQGMCAASPQLPRGIYQPSPPPAPPPSGLIWKPPQLGRWEGLTGPDTRPKDKDSIPEKVPFLCPPATSLPGS